MRNSYKHIGFFEKKNHDLLYSMEELGTFDYLADHRVWNFILKCSA